MKKKGKRIIGYCRESTVSQFNDGFNIDDQEKRIRSYMDIYYTEDDELTILRDAASAKDLNRPKMNEAINMMKNGETDVFIVYSLDRMTRRVKDLAYMLDIFQKNKVQLLSISEKIDTKSAMGRFFIYLIVLIAQWEQDTIASRTERGMIESAMQGNYAKPGNPLGYLRNPEDNHKLIVDPEAAEIVKYIFNELVDNDMPVNAINHKLIAMNACGRKWGNGTITHIIHNKIYYGTMELKGKEFPNIAQPLISKETYNLAQKRLKSGTRVTGEHYLFRGYVRCTCCDRIMGIRTAKSKTGKKYMYYICPKCLRQIPEKDVLNQVKDEFTVMLKKTQFQKDLSTLEESCASVAESIQDLPMSFFLYGLDSEYIQKLIDRKKDEKELFERNIMKLKAGIADVRFEDLPYSEVRDFLNDYVEMLDFNVKTKQVTIRYMTAGSKNA